MTNKKSLIGKILLGILALIIIIFIILGVSAYQASKVITVVREESTKIENASRLLAEQKDCSNLEKIETSFNIIEKEVSSACKNPALKIAISKVKEIPVKCDTLPELKRDFENKFSEVRTYCENPEKFNESIMNGAFSEEELKSLAQKYGIEI